MTVMKLKVIPGHMVVVIFPCFPCSDIPLKYGYIKYGYIYIMWRGLFFFFKSCAYLDPIHCKWVLVECFEVFGSIFKVKTYKSQASHAIKKGPLYYPPSQWMSCCGQYKSLALVSNIHTQTYCSQVYKLSVTQHYSVPKHNNPSRLKG